MDEKQIFVYDNIAVEQTGRCASRTLPSGKVDVVYEITPVDKIENGGWRKWVRIGDLYTVNEVKQKENK